MEAEGTTFAIWDRDGTVAIGFDNVDNARDYLESLRVAANPGNDVAYGSPPSLDNLTY